MNKSNFVVFVVMFVLIATTVIAATSMEDFSEAKIIIQQKTPYNQLNNSQFEKLGDYFMELMAGSNHEYMDQMMGGEGSASLTQVHINMGRRFYQEYLDTGQIQQGRMMGYGMMGGYPVTYNSEDVNNIGNYGMMGNSFGYMMYPGYGNYFWGLGLTGLLFIIAVIVLAVWLIFKITRKHDADIGQTPLETLKSRYVNGEISKKEYKLMRTELK